MNSVGTNEARARLCYEDLNQFELYTLLSNIHQLRLNSSTDERAMCSPVQDNVVKSSSDQVYDIKVSNVVVIVEPEKEPVTTIVSWGVVGSPPSLPLSPSEPPSSVFTCSLFSLLQQPGWQTSFKLERPEGAPHFKLLHEPNEEQRKSYKQENRYILPNPLIIVWCGAPQVLENLVASLHF